jgi:hypothetical protein
VRLVLPWSTAGKKYTITPPRREHKSITIVGQLLNFTVEITYFRIYSYLASIPRGMQSDKKTKSQRCRETSANLKEMVGGQQR